MIFIVFFISFFSIWTLIWSYSFIMLLQLLSLYASFIYLFIIIFLVLSFVQFEPNLRDKRLKVNGIGSPALRRLSSLGRGGGREGGEWYSTNVYTRGLCSEFEHLTLLCTIFHEKSTPFVYLLLTNGNFQFWLVNISTAHDLARSLAS